MQKITEPELKEAIVQIKWNFQNVGSYSLAISTCLTEHVTETRFTSQKTELKKITTLLTKAFQTCSGQFSLIESPIIWGLRGLKKQMCCYAKPSCYWWWLSNTDFNVVRLSPQVNFKLILLSVAKTKLSWFFFHPNLCCRYSQSS